MKNAFIIVLLFTTNILFGTNFYFVGTCDKDALSYKVGEKITFKVQLCKEGKPVSGVKVKGYCEGDGIKREDVEFVADENTPFIYETSLNQAGSLMLFLTARNEKDRSIKGSEPYRGGAFADFDKIQKHKPIPTDFGEFWQKQLARLNELPMQLKKNDVKSNIAKQHNADVYEVEINSIGDRPAVACVVIPKNAKEKSLPIVVKFYGYSVMRAHPNYLKEAISITVSSHGLTYGHSAKYYKDLQNGELKDFGFENELKRPEDSYFYNMLLRDLRIIEYAKTLPQWNGKEITVTGGSMGGFQSIAMAALSEGITLCKPEIPWMCDISGTEVGRLAGWLPKGIEQRQYYDSVNFATVIPQKCKVEILAGLGDRISRPTGVAAFYNTLKCPKKIIMVQNKPHGYNSPIGEKTEYIREK